MSSKLFRVVMFAAALGGSGAAYAGSAQTHHCKMPDGTMDMKKTRKQCTAAKGTWQKDPPSADAKAPAKDAPAKDPPKAAPPAPAPAPKN